MTRILLVEDDTEIIKNLTKFLPPVRLENRTM